MEESIFKNMDLQTIIFNPTPIKLLSLMHNDINLFSLEPLEHFKILSFDGALKGNLGPPRYRGIF